MRTVYVITGSFCEWQILVLEFTFEKKNYLQVSEGSINKIIKVRGDKASWLGIFCFVYCKNSPKI